MPQEYDDTVSGLSAEGLCRGLLRAAEHGSLRDASVPTCLLLGHVLAVLVQGFEARALDVPTWVTARQGAVAQTLNAQLMRDLLLAEEELHLLKDAVRDLPSLRRRIGQLAQALGLPDGHSGATIVDEPTETQRHHLEKTS